MSTGTNKRGSEPRRVAVRRDRTRGEIIAIARRFLAKAALAEVRKLGGTGGLIALDRRGRMTMPFNTEGMYRGWIGDDGVAHVLIYK